MVPPAPAPQSQAVNDSVATATPTEDIGSETGYRYAYQDGWAAILACALLEDNAEFRELYCEHHEDILVRLSGGKFKGIQIKTRSLSSAPWKTNDDEVFKSLCRFLALDSSFSGQFSTFEFATNHFFYESAKNGQNLCHILNCSKEAVSLEKADMCVRTLVKKMAKNTSEREEDAFEALRKTSCSADLPKLGDARKALRETIARNFTPAREAVFSALEAACGALVKEMREASSLSHLDCLPAYIKSLSNSAEIEKRNRIKGKLFTKERVEQVLGTSFNSTPLLSPDPNRVPCHPSEMPTKLEAKLVAGGLSAVSVNLAKDLSASALHLFTTWRSRFGDKEALRRYNHLKTLILKDCAEAHEACKSDTQTFGRAMQSKLRSELKARTPEAANFGCSSEHLEGLAYELTGACVVWWSKPFDLKS